MVRFLPFLILPLLAACDNDAPAEPPAMRDPAVTTALWEPLLSDPDLVGGSRNGTTLSGGGPADGGLPLIKPDAEEIDRAREAARNLLGGPIDPAPSPEAGPEASPLARAVTAAATAHAVPFAKPCAASLDYSFSWAARLPASLPIYPRGAAQEAGGSDKPGCKLRVVNFQTAVPVSDVINFYYASAAKAGLAPRHATAGGDAVISGGKGSLSFAIYFRVISNGVTEVDLITNG
jgi:hypothetical protein